MEKGENTGDKHFSFFCNVIQRFSPQGHQNLSLFGKSLNQFKTPYHHLNYIFLYFVLFFLQFGRVQAVVDLSRFNPLPHNLDF